MQGSQLGVQAFFRRCLHNIFAFVCSQDLKTLEVEKLNPLSPEVISRQATINIGETAAAVGGQQQQGLRSSHAPERHSSVH